MKDSVLHKTSIGLAVTTWWLSLLGDGLTLNKGCNNNVTKHEQWLLPLHVYIG